MNCSRRIYKGNAYEICLPLVDSGVTLVRIYTRGDVIIEKEPEITADSMCIQLTADELAGLADGVIRYEAISDTDAIATNSNFILVTPDWYSGRTLDDIIQDAYDSGYTDGYEDGGGSGGYESGYTDGYESGYTDGLAACESGDTGDTPTAETRYFTITNTSNRDGVVKLERKYTSGSVTYRTSRDGINWTEPITYTATTSFSIPAGEYLMFDGDENNCYQDNNGYYSFTNNASGLTFKISGDVSTLLGGREDLAGSGLNGVFRDWTTLVDAGELNLDYMTLSRGGYAYMFSGCANLIQAPELPATNLGEWCYQSMFEGCTSLTTAPELPATVLARGCYIHMFHGCTSLTSAPVLPASNILSDSYAALFQGCTSLTSVTCYGREMTPIGGGLTPITASWLRGIETTGVFYCYPDLLSYWNEHRDGDGVPETWAIRLVTPYNQQYLTLEAIEDGYIRLNSMDNNPKGLIHVRKNYGEWEDYDQWTALQFDCVSGDTFEFRAAMDSYWAVNFGSSTAKYNAYGNIWSLVFDNELPENDGFWYSVDYLFSYLFWGSRLVDASNLWLGGRNTFIPPHGFEYTFSSCTYLVAAPELPMMNLGEYAYNCMFYGCSQLEVAPELPYNNPPTGAYERMFCRCGNLQYIKCDASNTGMTDEWVREVAGYGIFIQAPGVEWSTGWSGIPSGWDRYDYLFESDVKSITAHPEATSVTITIKSVYSWTRTSQPDWARTNKVSGQPGEVTVRIDIESATSPRFGDIVFTDEKGNTIKISVTQAEMPIIWVDDFPDGTSEEWGYAEPYDPEFCQEYYEHDSFDAYLDDYLADKQDNGCNKYKIYGEMNFEGVDYWIYRMVNPDTDEFYKVDEMPVAQGLLPKSTNLEEYRSKSMASDHTAFYPAFAHYLMDDGTEYNNDIIDGGGYVLVDTE